MPAKARRVQLSGRFRDAVREAVAEQVVTWEQVEQDFPGHKAFVYIFNRTWPATAAQLARVVRLARRVGITDRRSIVVSPSWQPLRIGLRPRRRDDRAA